jgi:hypothetical protein
MHKITPPELHIKPMSIGCNSSKQAMSQNQTTTIMSKTKQQQLCLVAASIY